MEPVNPQGSQITYERDNILKKIEGIITIYIII